MENNKGKTILKAIGVFAKGICKYIAIGAAINYAYELLTDKD